MQTTIKMEDSSLIKEKITLDLGPITGIEKLLSDFIVSIGEKSLSVNEWLGNFATPQSKEEVAKLRAGLQAAILADKNEDQLFFLEHLNQYLFHLKQYILHSQGLDDPIFLDEEEGSVEDLQYAINIHQKQKSKAEMEFNLARMALKHLWSECIVSERSSFRFNFSYSKLAGCSGFEEDANRGKILVEDSQKNLDMVPLKIIKNLKLDEDQNWKKHHTVNSNDKLDEYAKNIQEKKLQVITNERIQTLNKDNQALLNVLPEVLEPLKSLTEKAVKESVIAMEKWDGAQEKTSPIAWDRNEKKFIRRMNKLGALLEIYLENSPNQEALLSPRESLLSPRTGFKKQGITPPRKSSSASKFKEALSSFFSPPKAPLVLPENFLKKDIEFLKNAKAPLTKAERAIYSKVMEDLSELDNNKWKNLRAEIELLSSGDEQNSKISSPLFKLE